MLDLLLDAGGDLSISENGDITLTESVVQAICIRLRWFFEEWRLGRLYGLPYYEEVFVKNPNQLRLRQLFRDEIMKVEEVTDAKILQIGIDEKQRTGSIVFEASAGGTVYREAVQVGG